MFRIRSAFAFSVFLFLASSAASALEMQTYSYMDKNKDGQVTRKEWTSSTASFKGRDWNNDGVLTGDELRVSYKSKKKDLSFEEIVQMRFEELDVNNDNVLSPWEWLSERKYFDQLDDDGNRLLTRVEFHDRRDEVNDAFTALDKNRDGVLSEKESKLGDEDFERIDDNRDGKLTRNEFYDKRERGPNQYAFTALDRNKDGVLSPFEWRGSKSEFESLDADNNRVITVIEYNNRARANRPGI